MSGALLVDKPAGPTSHDVVIRVRREREGVKVGHAGTLDPFASGLLIVLLGRATRLQRYLLELPKTYLATARLGWTSTTGDPDGELTETGAIPERLELPRGEIEQTAPMTSAVKVGGERLYKKAHRGEEAPERPTRTVTIHRAELLNSDSERATFEIECSSGTYIRTLIEALGDSYCESLRRTAIGPHRVPQGSSREITAEDLMAFLPERALDASEAGAVSHGRAVGGDAGAPILTGDCSSGEPRDPDQRFRMTHEGRLIAIGRPDGENLRPEVVLA
ncbi:MAG: tRNA pseudouridine(55) synthase TruB [Actinobacteria bacterium]|nr:tRNA pseudouridine(55) synthase TruB [Actinomycetota bacterium]